VNNQGSTSTPTQTLAEWAAAYEKELKKMLGLTNELGDALDTINDYYTEQTKTATELGATSEQLAQMEIDHAAVKKKAIEDWVKTEIDYYNDMMGLNTELGDSLAAIDEHYAAAIASAKAAGLDTADLEASALNVKKKAIEDWYKSEVDYYNQMMGLNTDLGDSLAEIDAHYAAAIASAKAAGASEEQLAILTQAATAVKKKAEEDYWKDAVAYYNDMMGLTDPLQSSLDAANEKFNEYAAAAEGNAEKLAAIEKARGEVLAKLLADYMKALVKPFKDLFDSLTDWAKANRKSVMELFNYVNYQDETKTQQASRHLESKYKGLNPEINADTITNYGKSNNITTGDILKQYVTDLVDYFQSVTDALMAAYESLRNTRAAIDTDIADIANSMKTADELEAARKAQWESSTSAEAMAVAKKTFLDSDAEQQAKLAEESHTYIMSYYRDEMTALKAKHETEIANITAIRDKLKSLTYSSFNLALPGTKQATSAQDYEKLYAAAKAPGASSSAVSSYLSFVETYLQSSQDKYKSSDSYQAIYKKVMAEIGALDTQPGKTIEELTATQTDAIKDLNADVTRVLAELGTATDEGSKQIVNRLATIIEILEGLVGYGDQQPIPASVVDMSGTDFFKITAGMITPPAGFNPDTGEYKTADGDNPLWATVLEDNNISILEIMTYFYPLFYKQLESIGTKNNVDFFTISGMDKPTSGYNEETGEYTGNDPLWAAVLTDGNVSIVELMSFFYPLFYNQLEKLNGIGVSPDDFTAISGHPLGTVVNSGDEKMTADGVISVTEIMLYFYKIFESQLSDIRDSIQMFPDDFSIISGTGTTNDLSTGLQRPYTDEERRTKVLQDQKISTIEVMVYYYETFKQQLDKIIEGSGSGISQTDYFKITADGMSAFSSYSNGKEMATVAELLVVGFYSIIQFNAKLFLYIVTYLPKLADIATSLSAIAGKVTAPINTTSNQNTVRTLSDGLIDVIAVLDETNVQTAFLSSWVYDQETMPATIKTDIQFDKKDDVTEFLASWAYDQETAPTSILAKTFFDMNDPTTAAMSSWIFSGYIPTAYATVITTNIIRTIYEEAPPPPTPDILSHHLSGFADGGISYGSLSGYPVMLHGTEAVIPMPNGRSIPVDVKSTGNQSAQSDPEIKQLLKILVANQAQDKYLSVDGRQFKIFVQEQADINRVNANRRTGNETRRIT
jgi:phage host-nuclease inhibitor protein Gam